MTWIRIWIHIFPVRIQDPDPHLNWIDPKHCLKDIFLHELINPQEQKILFVIATIYSLHHPSYWKSPPSPQLKKLFTPFVNSLNQLGYTIGVRRPG